MKYIGKKWYMFPDYIKPENATIIESIFCIWQPLINSYWETPCGYMPTEKTFICPYCKRIVIKKKDMKASHET